MYQFLKGKKVLLIVPFYYGYEKIIQRAIEKQGAYVYLINDGLDIVSYFYRFIYVYFPRYKYYLLYQYYKKKLEYCPIDINYILIIRGDSVDSNIVKGIKEHCPNSIICMYQWDSIKHNQRILDYVKFCDKISTFDMQDAKNYNWNYRPLFFDMSAVEKGAIKYNISYICSLREKGLYKRINIYKKVRDILQKNHLCGFYYMFIKRAIYFKHKYINRDSLLKELSSSDVQFKELSLSKTFDIYNKSAIILDFTKEQQKGFTMRTIESIGFKCKLITNNENIKKADFYNPNNILVYNNENFSIPIEFLTTSYEDIDDELYYYYSVDGWLKSIIFEK